MTGGRTRISLATILTVLACTMALAYLIWPYVTLSSLYLALKGADQAALSERVDWRSLKANLASDINRLAVVAVNRRLDDGQKAGQGPAPRITWKASALADRIAATVATPAGLIALYDDPAYVRCLLAAFRAGDRDAADGCRLAEASGAPTAKRESGLQGPNLSRLAEKTGYAFFTGLLTFRLEVVHDGVPYSLRLRRRGWGWKLTRIFFDPFKKKQP